MQHSKKIAVQGVKRSLIFGLNLIAIVAAIVFNESWIWAISIVSSLTFLSIYHTNNHKNHRYEHETSSCNSERKEPRSNH
jgi:hypothetical protein